MLNALTIDIEDYFHVHAFSDVVRYEDWDKFECRIEHNTDRLLEILDSIRSPILLKPQHKSTSALNKLQFITHNSKISTQHSSKGTFFVLGWIAERYPDLIRRIHKEGHEIACHGYAHQLIYSQSKEKFREDIKKSKAILEEIIECEVMGYRAPSYSITDKCKWAFEILIEEGFKYDSSIFPIRHDFYGIPSAPRFPFIVSLNGKNNVEFSVLNYKLYDSQSITHHSKLKINNSITHSLINSNSLIEFPLSTIRLFGMNLPVSGGGYFRLFPYSVIKSALTGINGKEQKPFIFYIHPWEIDSDQPRIRGLKVKARLRHYINLHKTEKKFKRLLGDFEFSTIRQVLFQNS